MTQRIEPERIPLPEGTYTGLMDRLTDSDTKAEQSIEPLQWILEHFTYKRGWEFRLTEREELATLHRHPEAIRSGFAKLGHLQVYVQCTDSISGGTTLVIHNVAIPMVAFMQGWNVSLWRRWLLGAIIGIETHEACECFQLCGHRPYWPPHGTEREPGNPYRVPVLEDEHQARKGFGRAVGPRSLARFE